MSADENCLFSPCSGSGELQTFKTEAVQKIAATSKEKRDNRFTTLSASQILAHKSCYCSYTSRSRNYEQSKRKTPLNDPGVAKRLFRSQSTDFDFKRDCLLCGDVCKPKTVKTQSAGCRSDSVQL